MQSTSLLFSDILKFNPYHDSKGRFTSGGSATSFTYKPGASTAHSKAIEREKEKADSEKGFKGTLYHGSPNKDIKEFDMSRAGQNTSSGEKLLFFTDNKKMADDFSYERLEGSSKFFQQRGKKGRVYEVDVEMKNPLDLRKLSDKDIDNVLKLDLDGILTKEAVKQYANSNHQLLKAGLNLTSDSLKELGYDGLIANTGKAGHNSLEYAVVDSKQAKIRKSDDMALSFLDVMKFNPYHGKDGRFTSGSGGGASAASYKIELGYGKNKQEYETDQITSEFFQKKAENAGMLATAETRKEILGNVKSFYSQYQKGTANKDNFYVNTIAEFKETKRPRRKPDHISYTREGKVSSEYWYSDQGVIRGSKHWGSGVASCDWFMEGQRTNMRGSKQYGECSWSDFTQKSDIVTSGNKATMSTFENTVGGIKRSFGGSTPIVRGFNDEIGKSYYESEDSMRDDYIRLDDPIENDNGNFQIAKADEDKRLVFGWALVSATSDGKQIIDHQGDIVDQDELEEGAYEYVLNFRDAGEEHIGTLRKKARMVESVVFTEEKLQAMGIPLGTVPYGWWIGFYVDDDNTWELIKNGTYKMFSIEGRAIREPVDEPLVKSDKKSLVDRWLEDDKPFRIIKKKSKSFSYVMKFNPNHDNLGRFSSGSGGGAIGARGHLNIKYSDDNMEEEFYGTIQNELRCTKEQAVAYGDAVLEFTDKAYTGIRQYQSRDGYEQYAESANNLEEYIEKAPKWNGGTLYRGIRCQDANIEDIFKPGTELDMRGTSSWSSEEWVAESYGSSVMGKTGCIFVCESISKATSISHLSTFGDFEKEVVASKDTKYISKKVSKKGNTYYVYLDEVTGMKKSYSGAVAKTFSEVLKFNPYHDQRGRFTSGSGGNYSSFTFRTKDPSKQHMADKAVARMKERASGGGSNDESISNSNKIREEFLNFAMNLPAKGLQRQAREGTGIYSFKHATPVSESEALKMKPIDMHFYERDGKTLVHGVLDNEIVFFADKSDSKGIKALRQKEAEHRQKQLELTRQRPDPDKIQTTSTYDRWKKNNDRKFADWFFGNK